MNRGARELARAIKHPFSLAYAQHHTSWLYQLLRLPTETQIFSEEQVHASVKQGFPLFQATGAMYKAAGHFLAGELEQALPDLRSGLSAYRGTGASLSLPYYLSVLAQGLAQAGLTDEAKSVLDDAFTQVEVSNERCQEAELHRLKGELAGREQLDVAERHFLKAIAIAQKQGSKAWELRATVSLARLYSALGRQKEARDKLFSAYGWYSEGFGTPDLEAAKAVLDSLAA
jgi:predicted ATPase